VGAARLRSERFWPLAAGVFRWTGARIVCVAVGRNCRVCHRGSVDGRAWPVGLWAAHAQNLKVCCVTEPFALPIVPRYAEVDQQGVVFNGHYLTWLDEASTAFFEHLGVPFTEFNLWGLDVQVVHAELDYLAPVRWRDSVRVATRCESIGTTSFTLCFDVLRRGDDGNDITAVRGRNVYVVVSAEHWTKCEIPPRLREALTSVAGQGQNVTGGGTVTP
jgi:acyl-CoA thioester hydrolase